MWFYRDISNELSILNKLLKITYCELITSGFQREDVWNSVYKLASPKYILWPNYFISFVIYMSGYKQSSIGYLHIGNLQWSILFVSNIYRILSHFYKNENNTGTKRCDPNNVNVIWSPFLYVANRVILTTCLTCSRIITVSMVRYLHLIVELFM